MSNVLPALLPFSSLISGSEVEVVVFPVHLVRSFQQRGQFGSTFPSSQSSVQLHTCDT